MLESATCIGTDANRMDRLEPNPIIMTLIIIPPLPTRRRIPRDEPHDSLLQLECIALEANGKREPIPHVVIFAPAAYRGGSCGESERRGVSRQDL